MNKMVMHTVLSAVVFGGAVNPLSASSANFSIVAKYYMNGRPVTMFVRRLGNRIIETYPNQSDGVVYDLNNTIYGVKKGYQSKYMKETTNNVTSSKFDGSRLLLTWQNTAGDFSGRGVYTFDLNFSGRSCALHMDISGNTSSGNQSIDAYSCTLKSK